MPKCICKTKDGVRCSREVSVVGDKCYQHEKAGCKFGSAKAASGKKTPPKVAKNASSSKAVVCECFTKDGNHCKNKVTVGTMCTRHTNAGGCSNWSPRHVVDTPRPVAPPRPASLVRPNTYEIMASSIRPNLHVIRQTETYVLAGIFTGSGPVPEFVSIYFNNLTIDNMDFKGIIQDLQTKTKGMEGGSSAAIVFIDKINKKMTVVNIGSNRVMTIKGNVSKIITVKHDTSNDIDVANIRKNGGQFIYAHGALNLYNTINPDMATRSTRSIGYHDFIHMIRTPDIQVLDYSDLDYVLIASPVVFARLSETEIKETVLNSPIYACDDLIGSMIDKIGYETDNMSALLIDLTHDYEYEH